MRDDGVKDVRVAFDGEIKAPRLIDPGLPQARGFVVFLGAERRVLKILGEKTLLLVERLLHVGRRGCIVSLEFRRVNEPHLRVFGFLHPAQHTCRFVERRGRFSCRVERPGIAPVLEILHAFFEGHLNSAVDECLGGHDHLALPLLNLEVVARLEAETVVQLFGDDDLATDAQLDGGG